MKFSTVKPKVVRSPKWPTFRKKYMVGKSCAVCGSKTGLEAHHIIPVHIDPSRELDETNLMPLCESRTTIKCHLVIGHLGSYFSINPTAKEDAAYWEKKFRERVKV